MSLRVRLLLAVSAVALVALAVADVATYSWLQSSLYTSIDQSLDAAHMAVEREVSGHSVGPGEARVQNLAPGTYVAVRGVDGQLVEVVGAFREGGQHVIPKLPAKVSGLSPATASGSGPGSGPGPGLGSGPFVGEPRVFLTVGSTPAGGPQFRVRISELASGSLLILATPLDQTRATLHRLRVIELEVTAAALVAAAALGWWLVGVGLRPLADVERTADAIAEGEFEQRVPGANSTTEVGRLAAALNTMLGRIDDAFRERDATEAELRRSEERLRHFVADASHELRTPLAAVSAYAELFDRGASSRPADLGRVMTGIRSETARMGRLVEDLLLLARLDEGRPLERQPVELVALATEAVETAAAVGPEWPIQLHADHPVQVVGDRARLRQVLDNLLANVRAHTPPGTTATVSVVRDGDAAAVEVADAGPGMTAEQTARVFERFYRADSSRSRQHGGTGLGLGIVTAIVAAHGGQVAVSATPGAGSTFTIRLPLAGPGESGDGV